MLALLRNVAAPIFSLALFMLGSGLFSTYQAVRLRLEGVSNEMVGAVAAAFAAGLVIGSRFIQHWIVRVGHIRALAAFASAFAAITMVQGLLVIPWLWIPLRLLSGICTAGLYIIVESWLLEGSTPSTRGRVLSIYMIAFYLAQGSGQLLLNLGEPLSLLLFCIPVICAALSVWPVAMTSNPSPPLPKRSYVGLRHLYKIAPAGVIGCFLSGMILGSFYGLGPVFVQDLGLSFSQIGIAMALWVLGGLTLQWPVGYLSDLLDRRIVIALVSLVTGSLCVTVVWMVPVSTMSLLLLIALFGGLSFTIYPLSISHTSDRVDASDLVATTASLLLVYGLGSVAGPLLAPLAMIAFGPSGLMLYFATLGGLLALFSVWRRTQRASVPTDEKSSFVPLPRMGPVSHELNPQLNPEPAADEMSRASARESE